MTKEKQIGITVKKSEDFSEWYTQVIQRAELADYSAVSGCIVFRPRAYQIWEKMKDVIDTNFKKIGVKNAYFPLFIPENLLSKESEHVEGFTPEVAWVTHAGNTKLSERLAVRPTSETIMYDSYSKWIRSHRDLPLRLNQWNNVVRWEFKHPVPFLRTREFLWNEGHNVYSNTEELDKDKELVLGIYSSFLKDYMAIPGIIGKKSEKEKFAGAVATYSIESMLPNGKAIQGPDYHDDGQVFAKAYDIQFLNEKGEKQYAYQSTYAITTRMIGVMIAMHSDDKGLIIPPRIAETKAVIVPILFEKTKKELLEKCVEIKESLKDIEVELDSREEYSPGWKFNDWEMKGIPIRIEFGPKDLEKGHAVLARRDTGDKEFVKLEDLSKRIKELLVEIQDNLFNKASKFLQDSIVESNNYDELKDFVNNKKMVKVPFCDEAECEEIIKEELGGAKSLNSPLDSKLQENDVCIKCKKKAKGIFMFGKSY